MHWFSRRKQPPQGPLVATIGHFDGGHLGHQAMLKALLGAAGARQTLVVTFEPLAHEHFKQQRGPRLMSLRDKIAWLWGQGVDHMLCLRFNDALAQCTADSFVARLKALGVTEVIVGPDFRFGRAREGGLQTFKDAGLAVTVLPVFEHEGLRVSSTAVRTALVQGDVMGAAHMLGRPYAFTGRVIHGAKRGRLLGFPTANIPLNRYPSALRGVYAVCANGLLGVANFGVRPTVDGTHAFCEVHLFHYSGNLYGQRLTIVPRAFIREEQRYASLEKLRAQIARDVEAAQKVLAHG